MSVLQRMTIKDKLVAIIIVSSTVALVLTGITFIVWGQTAFLQNASRKLSILAEMIANNCEAPLAFGDAQAAQETVNLLHAEPSIVFGCVYTKRGRVFASYSRNKKDERMQSAGLLSCPYNSGFDDGCLTIVKLVILDEEIIGTVRIRADLNPMYVVLKRDTTTVIAVLLFVFWALMLFVYSSVEKNLRTVLNSFKNDSVGLLIQK